MDSLTHLSICYPCKTKCGEMPPQPQEQLETDNSLSFSFWPKRVKTLSAPSHQGLQESVKSADSTHFSSQSKRCQMKQNGKTFQGVEKLRRRQQGEMEIISIPNIPTVLLLHTLSTCLYLIPSMKYYSGHFTNGVMRAKSASFSEPSPCSPDIFPSVISAT